MTNLLSLFPTHYSVSSLNQQCPRRSFYYGCLRFERNESNHHLKSGNLFARGEDKALTVYHETRDAEKAVYEGCQVILNGEDTGDKVKSNENTAKALERFFKKYPLGLVDKPALLLNGNIGSEYGFEIDLGIPHPDLPGETIKFIGFFDRIIDRNGQFVLRDSKTTGQLPRLYIDSSGQPIKVGKNEYQPVDYQKLRNKYGTTLQLTAYPWAFRKLGNKESAIEIVVIPITAGSKDKPPEEPCDVMSFTITDNQRDVFEAFLYDKICKDIIAYQTWKETGDLAGYPCNYSSCFDSFSGKVCPFYEACFTKGALEQYALEWNQTVYLDRERRESISLAQFLEERK